MKPKDPGYAGQSQVNSWLGMLSSLQSRSDSSQAACMQEPVTLTLLSSYHGQTRSHVSPQMPHSIKQTPDCPSTTLAGVIPMAHQVLNPQVSLVWAPSSAGTGKQMLSQATTGPPNLTHQLTRLPKFPN